MKSKNKVLSSSDEEDLRVLASIKKGDIQAYEVIFKKYKPYVYKMMTRFTRDREQAKDMMMELFTKVYKNINKYERSFTFNAWITRVAKNYAIDYIRKKNQNPILSNPIYLDEPLEGNTEDLTFELKSHYAGPLELDDKMTHEARLAYMYQMIDTLPQKDKEVLNLLCREKKSYDEISEILGVKLNAVKLRILRARNYLLQIVSARQGEAYVNARTNIDDLIPSAEII